MFGKEEKAEKKAKKEDKKAKKEAKEFKKDEETLEKATESVKKEVKKLEKKEIPLPNELVAELRKGEKVELFGLPFVVKERNGRDVILRRTDIK